MSGLPVRGFPPSLRARLALLAVSLAGISACAAPGSTDAALTVGVAASLQPVVDELARDFDGRVTLAAGASGALAAQVRQGAPIDLFISADRRFTDELASSGLLDSASVAHLAKGELVAVTTLPALQPSAASPAPAADPAGLAAAPSTRHVALANPELAPYGAAARQYLADAGVWDVISDKLVYGENAAQTLQFVATGNAEVGFVPLSLALASTERDLRLLDALDADASSALVVTAGVVIGARQAQLAEQFIAHAQNPSAGAVWERYGYTLPGESEGAR